MIEQKRAIEALRSGVPNGDAVRAIGTTQQHIEELFHENLTAVAAGERPGGFLIEGAFGSGKSHLLECLQHRALERNFITSKIIVGRETPLHDPAKVFRAAIESARVPGRRGEAMDVITAPLDYTAPRFDEFRRWVTESGLNERFAATVFLLQHLQDPEFAQVLLRFWSGDTVAVAELRRQLKACGEGSTYTFPRITTRELAVQRFQFAPRLMQAAGFAGWVLLFDEVELVAQYSLLQRARSYAEIARWMNAQGEPIEGVTSVMAFTNEFAHAVLEVKHDRDDVPNKLRQRGTPADIETADLAQIGMALIKTPVELRDPDDDAISRAYALLKQLHGEAYDWTPPDVSGPSNLSTRAVREYVRSWIFSWDLRRLDPDYRPNIEIDAVDSGLDEDEDMEGAPADEWEDASP